MASPWQQWRLKGERVMNDESWQGGVIHAVSDIGTWQGTVKPRLDFIFPLHIHLCRLMHGVAKGPLIVL